MADETAPAKTSRSRRLKVWLADNKSILEVVGLVGALAGLVVLMIQTYQVGQQTEALRQEIGQSARQDVFSRTLDANMMAFENPILMWRITAAEGTPPALALNKLIAEKPESKEVQQAYQLAYFYIDFYDYIMSGFPESDYPKLGETKEPDEEGYIGWSNTIKDIYAPGSFICNALIENSRDYGESYIRRLKGAGLCPGL
jgi:hypothetical protein